MISSDSPEKRVLIVGADHETRRLCRAVLGRSGFSVDAVDTGIEAIIAARKCPPMLCVMEHQLTDVPACEAIKWLRSIQPLKSTPILVLSSELENDMAPPQAGTSPLRKPISPAALQKAIYDLFPYCVS